MIKAEAPPPLARISRSVPSYGGHGKAPKKQSFFVDPRNSKSPFWRKNFGTEAKEAMSGEFSLLF